MCRIKKADRQGINEDALGIVNNEKLILTTFVVKKQHWIHSQKKVHSTQYHQVKSDGNSRCLKSTQFVDDLMQIKDIGHRKLRPKIGGDAARNLKVKLKGISRQREHIIKVT